MMEEENKLTVEEMRSLISISTLLPALLDKIISIHKDIEELKKEFKDMKDKFNKNTSAVLSYKDEVDDMIKKNNIKSELDDIKLNILKIENSVLNITKSSIENKSDDKTKIVSEEKEEDDDEIKSMADKILMDHKGRKSRLLTVIDIKKAFKVDDKKAREVIQYFIDKKMYDEQMRILKFPKK